MAYLKHHGIKGQEWGVRRGPPYPIEPEFQNTAELSKHMRSFKYKEFDRLMSPDEVRQSKSGSCHDQVLYEMEELRRMGKTPKALFMMEYSGGQGGMTHSLAYYEENGATHWFENAWTERAGDKAYKNLASIKAEIKAAHKSGEFGDYSTYKNIIFGEFNPEDHQIGEDLQDLVDRCLR